jgi:adenine phosphoribosyltransferase
MNLKMHISTIPDFPKSGVLFRDIAPILSSPIAMREVLDRLIVFAKENRVEKIAAFESRGFVFGAPLAVELGLPFVMLRKSGKLPGKTVNATYALEYGESILELQVGTVNAGERVLLVDDLLATGGTSKAGVLLVEKVGGIVAGIAYVIELEELGGREVLGGYTVSSLVKYEKNEK